MKRIEREQRVVSQMIEQYCRRKHKAGALCDECAALRDYALMRLVRCPKGECKGSCRKCEIHCYSPAMRMRISEVMRYMGPRMMFVNPIAAIRHLFGL